MEFNFSSHIQYSQFQVNAILSSIYIGQLPSSFIGGYLAYRYSAIRIFLASFGAGSIAHVLGPVMFGNFRTAVIHRVLAGLVEGLCEPAAFGVLSQNLTPRQSARVSPYIFAAYYFGQSLGKISTGFLTQRLAWQTAFYMFGGLGITWAAVSVGFAVTGLGERHDALDTQSQDKEGFKTKGVPFCHIFTSPAVWAYIMILAASYVWEPTLLPLYFQQSFGVQVELLRQGKTQKNETYSLFQLS
ncbi:PREDICTED: vesicular glutamate transporter 1-like [Branchiostoma belcheri]|uniref:Vesicular glutamate transporter 1-like n=1 Tax=Branchiostoma belcheri TaxID=7741 RepID=A0A6P4ZBX0_BRABE|nr:PREDICTED: vesicular glutamate transporter 1-like [Branchiostoma belcheri]